jgi:hypothetical protein
VISSAVGWEGFVEGAALSGRLESEQEVHTRMWDACVMPCTETEKPRKWTVDT